MGCPGIRHLIQLLIDCGRPVAVDRHSLVSVCCYYLCYDLTSNPSSTALIFILFPILVCVETPISLVPKASWKSMNVLYYSLTSWSKVTRKEATRHSYEGNWWISRGLSFCLLSSEWPASRQQAHLGMRERRATVLDFDWVLKEPKYLEKLSLSCPTSWRVWCSRESSVDKFWNLGTYRFLHLNLKVTNLLYILK